MSLWAIIPAKDPWLAKSRLAGILPPTRRWSLSMQLLEHTLRAASAATRVDRCLVVSSAAPHLALARDYGAVAVHELRASRTGASQGSGRWGVEAPPAKTTGDPLNAALRQAAEVAIRGGAAALLILHADLLLISAEAIDGMVRALPEGPGLVLAPDRHFTGTNALLMRPPMAIPFLFGPGSFDAHQRLAGALHVPLVVHESLALAGDLDTPDDLAYLSHVAPVNGERREPRRTAAVAAGGERRTHRPAVPARSSSSA
ncbi:MAG TPA: 2-phospho-L-lactate guanylyltransferase [Chloroflexota bacterium]|nr:2-phospho-L-lactate guanylyltransferase [Chloroflexota bacterium]